MPPRTCAPGPATSRRASSRFGRLPTERSRPIRTSSTSSGAACRTPRCPPGPTSSDQEVSDLAYFITTFSPDFSNPENVPKPVPLPSAPTATKESIELGKKLYEETGCVKCHGTLGRGDGPSAPTLMDDLGHPIRPADLAQSWTFRGGSSREDIFRTMSTGLNGTPMPSFARRPHSPSSDGRSRTSSSLSRGATGLAIPTSSSPSTSRIRSIWRRGPRASRPLLWPAFRSSGRSWSPDARSIRPRPP